MPQEQKSEPTSTFTAKAGLPGSPQPLEVHPLTTDIKPWDLDSVPGFEHVGKPRPRIEGPLKVTGKAKYTFDVKLPGMLYGRMVGATVPAAEILSIDTSKAEALAGVKAVWTTDSRVVRFAGQDVAAVAAVSPDVARDAARLVKVSYRERPFTHELREAMKPDAPRVFNLDRLPAGRDMGRNGNVAGPRLGRANRGDVEKGFAEAEVIHEGTYYCPVHTHAPLETHGVVAAWEGEQLTVYASTQAIFAVREGVAEALGIDRKNVRVICEHMGGGFGSKLGPSATGSAFSVVACRLAKLAGAPVKLMLDRHQEHLCTGNAPSALMKVKLGAKKDGTLTAAHFQSWGSAGVAGGAGTSGPAGALHGKNPNFKAEEWDVFTNAGPAAPLRAPGHSQGAFGIESAMDELADKLGIDPLELRKKNEASPVRMAQYDVGAKAIGWERRNKKAGDMATGRLGAALGPRKRGIGMANGNWYVFASENSNAQVRVHRDGSVEVITGCQDIGTGYRTAMMVVAAEELGIEPGDVTLRLGDTQFPEGPGSGGSVTTNSMAPVVRLAASQARGKLFELAAPLLGAKPDELDAAHGKIFLASDTGSPASASKAKAVSFKQAAAKMSGESIDSLVKRPKQYETFRGDLAGTQFAEVEVDVETGVVRVVKLVSVNDCGLPVNPLTTQSQVIGAMIQGVSWALLENRVLDRNVGTMLNPNMESYKILAPADMFEAESILTPVANMGNNTSTAGIGEPPIVPTLAAVANAVFNAIGARVRELPLSPDRVLQALSEARRA
jgi:xanthine dehydrogenase YagR molybdenum-binding subunit